MEINNTTKAFVIPLIAVVIIAATTAMWSDTLKVNTTIDTGRVSIVFVNGSITYKDACGLRPGYGDYRGNDWNATYYPNTTAVQLDKDVGCTEVTLVDSRTLNITIYNAYPWYYNHIAFKIVNEGTVPVKIWRVIIDGHAYYSLNATQVEQQGLELDLNHDGVPDITVWWGDNFGAQLEPGQGADISLTITVLEGAPQGSTLSFTAQLQAVQWNEYTAGPIGG